MKTATHRLAQLALALSVAALAACGSADSAPAAPTEITRDTTCSLDGMTLMDYPGPKAQMLYEKGDPDFFCDTIEMFAIYLKPEQQKRIRAIYVQDMAQADWNQPAGHWIDAKTAFYVAGSKARGSMGGTLASFAREQDAQAFAAKQGGKVVRFDQVTPEMAMLHGGVLDDHKG
jgi:copper chaperone NosL